MLRTVTDDQEAALSLEAGLNDEVDALPGDLATRDDKIWVAWDFWLMIVCRLCAWCVPGVCLLCALGEVYSCGCGRNCGKVVEKLRLCCGFLVEKSGDFVEMSASDCGFSVEKVEAVVDNSLFLVEEAVEFGENLEISTGGAMMTESR